MSQGRNITITIEQNLPPCVYSSEINTVLQILKIQNSAYLQSIGINIYMHISILILET